MKDPAKLPVPINDYQKQENDYYDPGFEQLKPLWEELSVEIKAQMAENVESIPRTDGPFKHRQKMVQNAEYPTLVRIDLNDEFEDSLSSTLCHRRCA